uniref:DUF3592 domain-containing protein n=1 Tax=Chryseobacterium oranimense TaxID=421058 RepID=UPI00389AF55B
MNNYKIICLIFFFLGICLCLIGIYIYTKHMTFSKYGVQTKGSVKEIEKRLSHNLSGADEIKYTYYLYTLEYLTEDGKKICAKSNDGIKKSYALNENIDILYNSKNVTEFIIIGENVNKRLSILFTGIGILSILISIMFYFK